MKKRFIALTALCVLILTACGEPKDGQYAQIAQCLTEKGVKFYGAFWCPHCLDQKRVFGEDMRYITYVECDPQGANGNPDACRAAGVSRYPTWVFPGQDNVTGVQQPNDLAKKANCSASEASTSSEDGAAAPATTTEEPAAAAPAETEATTEEPAPSVEKPLT